MFQDDASYKTFHVKMSLICVKMSLILVEHTPVGGAHALFESAISSLNIKVTISWIVIVLKNSYFSVIHLPSFYRTVQ